MKNKMLYYMFIIIAVILFITAFTLLQDTKLIAPVVIVIGAYLFIGAIIKLCKTNEKLKNTILCALDLLFWLP